MAVTVPGDNSLDIYISDIGLVVITDPENDDELLGFNVMVGGGMGRTHNKENTFARAADHLGFVHKFATGSVMYIGFRRPILYRPVIPSASCESWCVLPQNG